MNSEELCKAVQAGTVHTWLCASPALTRATKPAHGKQPEEVKGRREQRAENEQKTQVLKERQGAEPTRLALILFTPGTAHN